MKIEFVKIAVIIGCHPRHAELFIQKGIDQLEGLKSSMMKDGKWNPIHLMKKEDGDRPGLYLIDGVSTLTIAEALMLEELPAVIHEWSDDPLEIMTDLNTNEHHSSKGLYLLAEAHYKKYAAGQGTRTDLQDSTDDRNLYDRIAKKLKVKNGTIVKKLLRVGRTQESFFTSIDMGETPLGIAYRDCIAIEKQKREAMDERSEETASTATKAPEYSQEDVGEIPVFCASESTSETNPAIEYQYQDGVSKNVKEALKKLEKLSDSEVKMFFQVLTVDNDICICCGKKIEEEGEEQSL